MGRGSMDKHDENQEKNKRLNIARMKTKVFLEKLNNTIRSQLKAKNQKANDEMTKAMPVKNNVGVETFPGRKNKKKITNVDCLNCTIQ